MTESQARPVFGGGTVLRIARAARLRKKRWTKAAMTVLVLLSLLLAACKVPPEACAGPCISSSTHRPGDPDP